MRRLTERPLYRDRARAGVEREIEGLQHERRVHARRGTNGRGSVLAKQEHLQATVLLQLEAVLRTRGLADSEADLLAAVVDAAPDRRRAVARQVGGEIPRRRLHVRAIDEHSHHTPPRDEDEERKRPGQRSREGPEEGHRRWIYDWSIGPRTRVL